MVLSIEVLLLTFFLYFKNNFKKHIFFNNANKYSSHGELYYYIMRRRFASDYNNSARAVRVPRTVAPIQRDRSAYLLVVNTRQGYHLNFFFYVCRKRISCGRRI